MKPAPFVYHDPVSVPEAVDLLSNLENALVLAGGQSLMPLINARAVRPDHLIDLGRISNLDLLEEDDALLFVGAMARQRDVELSPMVWRSCPLLSEGLSYIGHRQTRNCGTIAGNFVHLAPSAELLAVGSALDVVLHTEHQSGPREIPILDFAVDYAETCLAPDELITGLEFSLWSPNHGYAFVEFAPRQASYAIVSVAALVELAPNGSISRAALGVSGVGPGPVRLPKTEEAIVGEQPREDLVRSAAAAEQVEAYSDDRASADYRRRLVSALTKQALTLAIERAAEKHRVERNGHA